jgi:hypothetical protein
MVKDEAGERQILPGQEGTLKQLGPGIQINLQRPDQTPTAGDY